MDLRQLNYFMAVAETGHLGRAAERLHLSQPPLTRQIQQLEARLGVALFKRGARGMALTAAGEALLRDARNIGMLVNQATDRAQRAGRGQAGRLDIGVFGSALFGLVPEVLAAFRAAHPEVVLALHQAQTPAQVPALRQGRVQLVFERQLPDEPDIEAVLVASEPMLLALSQQHPLAARTRINIEDLRDETLYVGQAQHIAPATLQLCRAHGFEPRHTLTAGDMVTAALLAATGQGLSFVPASLANVQFPGITYRPLVSRVPATMDLHCYFLRGERPPLLAAMLETVQGFRGRSHRAEPGQGAPRQAPRMTRRR